MSRPDWLADYRHEVPTEPDDGFWDVADEGSPSLDESFDRNLYEFAAEHQPNALLPRELRLRLTGERVTAGQLASHIAQEVLRGIELEVRGAARVAVPEGQAPEFALAGVSRGSAILHLVPSSTPSAGDEAAVDVTVDHADAVIEAITRLHSEAENEGDLREFSSNGALLRALHGLVETLDRNGLEIDIDWRAADGRHRYATLSERGRAWVRRQWRMEPAEVEQTITGRVIAISLEWFELRTGGSRTGTKYRIYVSNEETMLQLATDIRLGGTASVTVVERHEQNRLGIDTKPRYDFVGLAGSHDTLL